MGDPKPTMAPPRYADSRREAEYGIEASAGEYAPGFLKLAEKMRSEGRVLYAVVVCPVDTE